MTSFLSRIPRSVSFTGGLLIGLSIVMATFAASAVDSDAWEIYLLLGVPVIFTLGFGLHAMVVAKPLQH